MGAENWESKKEQFMEDEMEVKVQVLSGGKHRQVLITLFEVYFPELKRRPNLLTASSRT